jgi:hypothetical protein
MMVYGNKKSDGFGLMCFVLGALFALGGLGLATVGGITMFLGTPLLLVVTFFMLKGSRRWALATETPALAAPLPFSVPAESDVAMAQQRAGWAPSADSANNLPARVTAPKSAVETNTAVAA